MGDLRARRTGSHGASRRWAFNGCCFDEAEWALTIDGRRVRTEAKPLEILRMLLEHAGHVVSKDEMLDAIWPDVTVVEASLPTAVHKLRVALHDDRRDQPLIETVPGIGYRLAVPVTLLGNDRGAAATPPTARSLRLLATGIAASAGMIAAALFLWTPHAVGRSELSAQDKAQLTLIRHMDAPAIQALIDEGWNPDRLYGGEGNNALNALIENCEWDPGHDRRKMLYLARAIIDAGARYDRRNRWGDTAYSIAKAPRYCGADHPVTVMLRRLCVDSDGQGGDRCMASYELGRGKHFPG